ncbi:FG-GAP-like repeat-containing protein [Mucilaginibacter terrae]|uniref:FG-GAP-like repeat-containing protein n=1 Tax=Mucilaginibacter terrae TaxID=1955052 RepID=UPI00363D3366
MKLQLTFVFLVIAICHGLAQTPTFTKIDTAKLKPGWAAIQQSEEIKSEKKSAPEFKVNSPEIKAGTGAKNGVTQGVKTNGSASSRVSSATIDAGRTSSSIDVSGMGGSVFNIPITLPPGIGNIVPQIGLSYNSQAGNGNAGYGWNVSGLSAITRLTSTNYHDNMIKGVNFDQNDRFALDGQRLLLKSGIYGGDGAEYQTENYSNVRIISHGISPYGANYGPESFEVLYPDGSKAWYGYDAYSKTQTDYAISFMENPLGVRINYNYMIVENVIYISGIGYGGIGVNGLNLNYIWFLYKEASRAEHVFTGGLSLRRSQILDRIQVSANFGYYRMYVLSYDEMTTLKYQRLTSLQELTGDETKGFEPIYFSYENTGDVISSHTIANLSLSGIAANNSQVVTADFTGNGTMDFLLYPNAKNKFWAFYDIEPGSPYMQLGYEINTGPFRELFPATELTYNNKILPGQGMALVKDNGYNGLKFSVYSSGTVAPVYYQYEKEWNDIPLGQGYYSACDDQYHDGSPVNFDFISGDFNGDGMTDVISVGKSNSVIVYEYMDDTGNPGENWRSTPDQLDRPIGIGNCVQQYSESGSPVHFINLDRRLTTNFVTNLGQIYPYYQSGDKIYAADANGDGKTDLILVKSGVMTVYTLNQNNYLEYLWQTNDSRITNAQPSVLGDFNGDGKIDIMFSTGNNNLYAFFMSTGKGFFKHEGYQPFANVAGTWDGTPGVERLQLHYIIANDVNGDGKADIISAQTTTRNNNAYGVIDVTVHHNLGNSYTSAPSFSSGTGSSTYTNLRHYPIPIFLNPSRPNNNLEFGFMSDNSVSLFKFGKDFKTESQIAYISQDGVSHHIEYKDLRADASNEDITLYQSSYDRTYPYIDLHDVPGLNVVSKITRYFGFEQVSQIFGYGGAVSHAEGLGFLGFSELIRSNWHTSNGDQSRIFSTSIQDPLLRGANVRSFNSKSAYINPSIKNMAFTSMPSSSGIADGASINDYISRNDQLYSTQLLPNKVFLNQAIASSTKDMLTGIYTTQSFEYDVYQNLTKTTSNLGGNATKMVETSYDNNPNGYYIGRVLSQRTSLNNGADVFSSLVEYTYNGSLPTEIRKKSNNAPWLTENLTYDSFGNIVQKITTAPGGAQRTASSQYDPTGRFVIQETDVNEVQTSYTIDSQTGNAMTKTSTSNSNESYLYDAWGKQIQITDHLNLVTNRAYQKNGSNIEIVETDTEGRYTLTSSNALGQITETRNKNVTGQIIGSAFQYDVYGRAIGQSQPGQPGNYNQWNTTEFDEYGRIKRVGGYTGKMINYNYAGLSRTVNDGTKSVTTTKNALGHTVGIQDPGGNISYEYFANGELKAAHYAGMTMSIERDDWGRKTRLNDPTAGVFTYEYDGFDQLTKESSPKGVTQYTYDNVGKILEKKVTGDETSLQMNFTYDLTSKLVTGMTLINGDGNNAGYTYSYDAQKRLSSRVEDNLHARFQKNLTYDSYGRIFTETLIATNKLNNITAQKTIEYTYQNGELIQKTLQGTGQILWKLGSVNSKGQLSGDLQGSNLKTTYVYDAFDFPQQYVVEKVAGGVQSLMTLNYTVDAPSGLMTSRSNTELSWSENFGYDNLNRLTSYNDNNGNNSQSYDAKSRISNNSQLGDYYYDGDSYKQTELNNISATADSYYQSRALQQITYNTFKAPVEIIEQGHERLSFQYNAILGRAHMYYGDEQADKMTRRFRRHYAEDGSVEITNDIQSGTTSFVFYLGGDAYTAPALYKEVHTGVSTSSALYFLHRDNIGSIVLISNELGDAVEKRQFDAWGNIVKITDGAGNPLSAFVITDRGFTGHEHLLGVGLINMNGRLYDPKLHRFLSPDNFIQNALSTQNYNRFGYALNNPLMYTDQNGEFLHLIIGALVGGIVNWVAHGAQFSWKGLAYFGTGAVSGALGAGVGAGISSALGGGSFGAGFIGSSAAKAVGTGFFSGAVIGGGAGLASGFVSGFGNSVFDGQSFGSALRSGLRSGGMGALGGAFVGGMVGGIDAAIDGRNFWTGEGIKVEEFSLSSNSFGDGEQYTSTEEMRTDYNNQIGSRDNMLIEDVEAKLNTSVSLADNKSLANGYNLNLDGSISTPSGQTAGAVTQKSYSGLFTKSTTSKVLIAPGVKQFELAGKNLVFKHEFMHAWHMNTQSTFAYNKYSEPAASSYSYAYIKALGAPMAHFSLAEFKSAIIPYPSNFSWLKLNKIVPLWLRK